MDSAIEEEELETSDPARAVKRPRGKITSTGIDISGSGGALECEVLVIGEFEDDADAYGRSDDEGEEGEDHWVDGLFKYRFRRRLWVLSDPRHKLAHGTGSGLWSSGEILSDFIAAHPQIVRGRNCLELGAGLGVVGITAATRGARLVVLSDVEAQIPLLRRNIDANFPNNEAVQAHLLDWRQPAHREGLAPWTGTWGVIFGSDIGYDQDLFEALLLTLVSQCSPSTDVFFALADRQEDEEPDVNDFIDSAVQYFDCRQVHEKRLEPRQSLTKVLHMKLRLQQRTDIVASSGSV